jgi:hypothetical protein
MIPTHPTEATHARDRRRTEEGPQGIQEADEDHAIGRRFPARPFAANKVQSIQPPAGFGGAIWEELADQGFLKRDGQGFFELVPGK